MENRKQTVAIIGAYGQVGTPLTKNLLEMGHNVIAIVRSENENNKTQLADLRSQGVTVKVVSNMHKMLDMVNAMKGADTLVCAVPGDIKIISESEPIWLEAAKLAQVKRFVPTEFGCHTMNLDYGDGILFDYKKDFHKKLLASGIGWTLIYTGLIYDYCLPNLRFFDKITTFGKMDLPIYTHPIEDIGKYAAMVVVDDRTINKCVQMDFQALTQNEMLEYLKLGFKDYPFEYTHYSEEFITDSMKTASDEVSAKKGLETDKERWGINNVIYVIDKLVAFSDYTLKASELYPDFKISKTAKEVLQDKEFVFEK